MTGIQVGADIYQEHRSALVGYATALVGPSDAADVVSEAMFSLLKNGRLGVAENPIALMYRAITMKARSMQRSGFRRRQREERFAQQLIAVDSELQPEVVDAVVGLSPRQRACVYLTYWEDLTPAAVADRLGIAEGTVRRYLARARSRLREVLDD